MVKVLMADLKPATVVEDLTVTGREFHERIVLGKKEYKCASTLD